MFIGGRTDAAGSTGNDSSGSCDDDLQTAFGASRVNAKYLMKINEGHPDKDGLCLFCMWQVMKSLFPAQLILPVL